MKLKRGGYIFKKHKSDHPPEHVHIFKDGRVVGKFDLENWRVMERRGTKRIIGFIRELRNENKL